MGSLGDRIDIPRFSSRRWRFFIGRDLGPKLRRLDTQGHRLLLRMERRPNFLHIATSDTRTPDLSTLVAHFAPLNDRVLRTPCSTPNLRRKGSPHNRQKPVPTSDQLAAGQGIRRCVSPSLNLSQRRRADGANEHGPPHRHLFFWG